MEIDFASDSRGCKRFAPQLDTAVEKVHRQTVT